MLPASKMSVKRNLWCYYMGGYRLLEYSLFHIAKHFLRIFKAQLGYKPWTDPYLLIFKIIIIKNNKIHSLSKLPK